MQHEWIEPRLNHGSSQCKWCLCTFEEASFALGMECLKRPFQLINTKEVKTSSCTVIPFPTIRQSKDQEE